MTSRQELSFPVQTQLQADGYVVPRVASEEALEVLNLKSVPTVWGRESGRPIYDRLPAISQQYQRGYDQDQAFVYLNAKTGRPFGPGSLQVVSFREEPSILAVENGTIVSYLGRVDVDALEVDISQLNFGNGLLDGSYQVGYLLSRGIPTSDSLFPGYELIRVENSELGDAYLAVTADKAAQGSEPFRALPEISFWTPTGNNSAGNYFPGSSYVIDFQTPVNAEVFTLKADPAETTPTATLAVYSSDDGIIWDREIQVTPSDEGWVADLSLSSKHRYWRFFFWDGFVTVKQILYTGEAYFPDLRAQTEVNIATPYIDNLFEEIEGTYILLATFEVKDLKILNVVDARKVSTVKYDPVADWLTDFQDKNLRCLLDDVEFYSEKYLAPPTANFNLYEELEGNFCTLPGEFDLEGENLSVILPTEVELDESTPEITPNQVILLKDPEVASDLSTKVYTNNVFSFDRYLDNGFY